MEAPHSWPYHHNFLTGWAAGTQLLMIVRFWHGYLSWQVRSSGCLSQTVKTRIQATVHMAQDPRSWIQISP